MLEDTSSRRIKEDKYKILRMSLILGDNSDKSSVIEDFKEAAREVDEMNQRSYDDGLRKKNVTTTTLEEEQVKMEGLVNYISGRIEQREALLEDVYNVTGVELTGLDSISDSYRLDEYKSRLKCISEYMDNTFNIEKIKKDIARIELDLAKANEDRDNSEIKNREYETTLREDFLNAIPKEYSKFGIVEIDKEMDLVLSEVMASKKTLDIFNKAFRSLEHAGISGREEKEYRSYVTNASLDFYAKREQEFFLKVLKLLYSSDCEYGNLLSRRESIHDILEERLALRKELGITTNDVLGKLYSVFDTQLEDIRAQGDLVLNIEKMNNRLSECQIALERYEDANRDPEIVAILQEFHMVNDNVGDEESEFGLDGSTDNLENTTLELEDNEDIEVSSDLVVDEEKKALVGEDKPREYANNEIVEFKEAINIDLETVSVAAKQVMLKVGKMLNVTVDVASDAINREEVVSPIVNDEALADMVETNVSEPVDVAFSLPDLPTVSSLTGDHSSEEDEISSFWGSDSNDVFEFPDISKLEDR